MLKEVTIKRYGELEVVYVHIIPRESDWWYCTVSRIHPSGQRILGVWYPRTSGGDNLDEAIALYTKHLENYWKSY